jgi:hypothetical protein
MPDVSVIDEIKNKLKASERELKEGLEHINILTHDLIEQLETLTGFFQIMLTHSETLTPAELKEFASRMDITVKKMLLNAGNVIEWRAIQDNKVTILIEDVDTLHCPD